MTTGLQPRTAGREVARAVAWAALYGLAILLGRATRVEDSRLALVWPAAGVAVLWLRDAWGRRARLLLTVPAMAAVTVTLNVVTGSPS